VSRLFSRTFDAGLVPEHGYSGLRAFGQRQCKDDCDESEHDDNGEIVSPRLRHEIRRNREEQKECDQDNVVQVTWQTRRVTAVSTDRAIAHARSHLVEETYSATLAVGASEHGLRR